MQVESFRCVAMFARKAIHFPGRKQGVDRRCHQGAFHNLPKQAIQVSACRLTERNCKAKQKHLLSLQKP